MPKHAIDITIVGDGSSPTGTIREPTPGSCIYLEAGKLRLAVHYDPIKKCMCIRSTTRHPIAIIPEANNSFHVRSL